jgi:hypothetical protein
MKTFILIEPGDDIVCQVIYGSSIKSLLKNINKAYDDEIETTSYQESKDFEEKLKQSLIKMVNQKLFWEAGLHRLKPIEPHYVEWGLYVR